MGKVCDHSLAQNTHGLRNRSRGLTPHTFWSSRSTLLSAPRSDLESTIDGLADPQILRRGGSTEPGWTSALKPVDFVKGRLLSAAIFELQNLPPPVSPATFGGTGRRIAYVLIAPHSPNEPLVEEEEIRCQNILRMPLPAAVSARSNFLLYDILPRAIPFIRKHLIAGGDICVACPTGKDLGPGVIVTALSLFFSDDGDLLCGDDIENQGEPTGE